MAAYRNDGTYFRWAAVFLMLSGIGLSPADGADPAAALAERGAMLARDASGEVEMVRFTKPLAEDDLADLARLPKLATLILYGPVREDDLSKLKTLRTLKSLQVLQSEASDGGLRAVAGLTNLELLVFAGTVTNDGLAELKPLTNLRTLIIINSHQVTDDGLAHLGGLPKLRTLSLHQSKITGTGLLHLHRLEELEKLALNGSLMMGQDLGGLAGLTQLRELQLVGCRLLGDDDLRHVAKLSNLRRLDLGSTQITNAGLEHLAALTSLRHLELGRTRITDSGLSHLAALDNLETLVVHETNVTQEGVAQLKQKLPKLTRVIGLESLALTPPAAATPATKRPGADPSSAERRRWAIVATDPKLDGFADLLMATISGKPSIELVERQQIKLVLDELRLHAGGLVAPDQAVRLGGLLKADALVLLEGLQQPMSSAIRLRLVEARSAIRLLDVVLPLANVDRQLQAIVAELNQAGAKLAVPENERRYVGVMSLHSEEPGESLKGLCNTLTALVEARLQQRRQFVVLERGELRRLTDESNLTGAELRLRGSAWLVEGGMRRRQGGALVVTCRLLAPAKGARQTLRVEAASGELVELRNQLVAEIEKAMGLELAETANVNVADEAIFFAMRRDWFRSAYQYHDCVKMAEVALALAPTPDNLRQALSAYSIMAHAADSKLASHEALPPAHRYQELSLEWMRKTASDSPMRGALSAQPFEPHVRLPLNPESAEDRQLRAATDQLSKERWDLLLAEAESRPDQRLKLLLHRLEYAAYLAETGREFAEAVPRLVEEIERTLGELGGKNPLLEDPRVTFGRLLLQAVGSSLLNTRGGSGRTTDQREWDRDEVAGLWAYLAKHDDVVVRMAGLSALARQPGEEGERAAEEMMDRLQELPLEGHGRNPYGGLASVALARLPADRADQFIEGLLRATQEAGDVGPLLRHSASVSAIVRRAEPKKKVQWSERILAALDQYAPPAVNVAGQRPGGGREATRAQMRAMNVASLRASMASAPREVERLEELRRARLPANIASQREVQAAPTLPTFSVSQGEGPWAQYVARPIELASQTRGTPSLRALWVNRNPKDKVHAEELVLIWSDKARQNYVERVAPGGGKPRRFGPEFPGMPRAFRGFQIASGADTLFVASDAPGFFCLRSDAVESIDEKQGAPASEVHQLAWWKDRLFVAYRDALASYDPRTRMFDVIASSLAVEPNNPLDGRGSFFVNALIPDEDNDCLWLHVQDNALPRARNGLWRYEPESKKFSQITSDRVSWSWTDDGIFLNVNQQAPQWMLLDPRDAQLTKLRGYQPWSPPLEAKYTWPRAIKVGDHIITEAGQLYTPDGKIHHVKTDSPWDHLQRFGPGFLTHFEPQSSRLWYVARKSKPEEIAEAHNTETGN